MGPFKTYSRVTYLASREKMVFGSVSLIRDSVKNVISLSGSPGWLEISIGRDETTLLINQVAVGRPPRILTYWLLLVMVAEG